MQIWVDADACPVPVKEILFRAAKRTGIQLTLIANHRMKIPPAKNIRFMQVSNGFDVADDKIVGLVNPGDLVITSDIPLAADILKKSAMALSFRGELFDDNTIGSRLNMRDFMDTLRASGIETGGSPAFSQTDRKAFADQFDRIITRFLQK